MGFNKLYLPELKDLKEYAAKGDVAYWIKRYQRADAVIGSTDSFDFIKSFMKDYEKDNGKTS